MRVAFRSTQGPLSLSIMNDAMTLTFTFPYDTSTSLQFAYRSQKASKSPYAAKWSYQRPIQSAFERPCNEKCQM
jgi:hypothetical protein